MKTKKKKPRSIYFNDLTYKDLKKSCVSRGMPFDEVASGDVPSLHNWLHHNSLKTEDKSLINDYDDWVHEQLTGMGKEYLLYPSLRLGYIGDKSDNEKVVKAPKIVKDKTPKLPKEKTEDGVVKGTKKAYTFELARKGHNLEYIIKRILKRFPDASEKSIKIWFRSAKNKEK